MRTKIVFGITFLAVLGVLVFTFWNTFFPDPVVTKYESLKKSSLELSFYKAAIDGYKRQLDHISESYGDRSKDEWVGKDLEQYNAIMTRTLFLMGTYDKLAKEYNAIHSGLGWQFSSSGNLPKGKSDLLPKKIKLYGENGK